MEITKRIIYLLHSRVRQELDEQEVAELNTWAARHPVFQQLLDEVSDEKSLTSALRAFDRVYGGDSAASIARMEQRIAEGMQETSEMLSEPPRLRRLRKWLPYAAALFIAASAVTYFFLGERSNQEPEIVNLKTDDIAPGGNRAQLTLANGQTIDLSEEQGGIIISNRITYLDGSDVVEERKRAKEQGKDSPSGTEKDKLTTNYYVLTTPKGGTYRLTLSDGSKVWLNAASTLKYPSQFSDNERIVELEGEGYFDIAKDAKRPFKVRSKGQEIEVLGTGFNVSAYPDDPETKTTLVEGAIQVINLASKIVNRLSPGEQSMTQEATTTVRQVDPNHYTAWKDGRFYFDHTPFDEMIAQVARWYNIEVVYRKDIPKETFTGEMGRDLTLQAMLNLLNISDAAISLEERTLIVQ